MLNQFSDNLTRTLLSHVVSQLVETQIARPFRKTETEKTDIYSYKLRIRTCMRAFIMQISFVRS